MKTNLIGMIAIMGLMASQAYARTVVAKCSNSDGDSLTVTQVAQGVYAAAVSEESTGDSYPTFHFRNLNLEGNTYSGKDIAVSIQKDGRNERAVVDAPSIGLNKEEFDCVR